MAPVEVLYGHLLRDPEDASLFIRALSHGASCQTQLVHNYTTGGTCVRKALRRPAMPTAPTRGAPGQFDRDAHVAQLLHAAAARDGFDLGVPKLLSATSAPHSCSVSHWGLCSGGTLAFFIERCIETDSVLPVGLALQILAQTLETLDFMYTKLDTVCPSHHPRTSPTAANTSPQPIFHRDLHANNLMLDFAPGHAIPSVQVIDFGLATHCPRARGDPIAWGDADDEIPDRDIPHVLALLRDLLTPLTMPPAQRRALLPHAAAPTMSTGYSLLRRQNIMGACPRRPPPEDENDDDEEDDHGGSSEQQAPLRTAYWQLNELLGEFAVRKAAALGPDTDMDTVTDTDTNTGPHTPPPWPMSTPSLQPVIVFLRRGAAAAMWDVEQGAAHREFRAAVLHPAWRGALGLGAEQPRLCRSVDGLLEWLGGLRGGGVGDGPWDVAEVWAGDMRFAVRGVLPGLGGKMDGDGEEDGGHFEDGENWG